MLLFFQIWLVFENKLFKSGVKTSKPGYKAQYLAHLYETVQRCSAIYNVNKQTAIFKFLSVLIFN